MSCLSVEILLACYQGEDFLAEQLDSLISQSYKNFRILARDDGSTDRTLLILEEYAKRFPKKFTLLPSRKRLGVLGNFNVLLEIASADIIFFCDQDDIWEKIKIEKTLQKFMGIDSSAPYMIHTDLKIVDRNARELHSSFWRYSNLDPDKGKDFSRLLVQNHATGCTMAINRSLRNLAYPIPSEALMHDWWMALIASGCGKMDYLPEKTVCYRQHASNVLGAYQVNLWNGLNKLLLFLKNPDMSTKDANLRHRQAAVFYERFAKILPKDKLKTLKIFLKSPEMSLLKRKWVYLTHRFTRQSLKKTVPYLFQNRPF